MTTDEQSDVPMPAEPATESTMASDAQLSPVKPGVYGWLSLALAIVSLGALFFGLGILWQLQQIGGPAADPVRVIQDWIDRTDVRGVMMVALLFGVGAAVFGTQSLVRHRNFLGMRTAPATAGVLAGTLGVGTSLCFLLTMAFGVPQPGGPIQGGGPSQFASEVYAFRIQRPDPLWTMTVGDDAQAIDPSAQLIAQRPTGIEGQEIVGSIVATPWNGPPIEGDDFQLRVMADTYVSLIPGADKVVESEEPIKIDGRRAFRVVVKTTDTDGVTLRGVIIFVGHAKSMIRLQVLGPADVLTAEAGGPAAQFLNAFELLDPTGLRP